MNNTSEKDYPTEKVMNNTSEKDYPTDVYVLIFSHIPHKEFPIDGCWQLSDNARKAIKRLKYDICCEYHVKSDEKDTNSFDDEKKTVCTVLRSKTAEGSREAQLPYDHSSDYEDTLHTEENKYVQVCEICQYHVCFTCCPEYTGRWTEKCDRCEKVHCGYCNNDCGYCSDPGWKKHYCKSCSSSCQKCNEVICCDCSLYEGWSNCEYTCGAVFHHHCAPPECSVCKLILCCDLIECKNEECDTVRVHSKCTFKKSVSQKGYA